jgi:hypothetical protein
MFQQLGNTQAEKVTLTLQPHISCQYSCSVAYIRRKWYSIDNLDQSKGLFKKFFWR